MDELFECFDLRTVGEYFKEKGLQMSAFAIILICGLFFGCESRPDGAPLTACSTMTPVHSGIQPQRSSSPYSITVTKNDNKFRVKLFSPVGEEIEGFILQARYSNDRRRMVDGQFTERGGISRTIDCPNGKNNTLTQVNPTPKREVVTEWTPSTSLDEDVIFRATVAKTFALFWTEIDSSPVRVKNDGPTSSQSQSERNEAGSNSKLYENCFVSKGCFGIPAGCINQQDCQVLLSYSKASDGIQFKLSGFLEEDSYMAMGLSYDQFMGDDSVTECVRKNSGLTASHSWNDGKRNIPIRELSRDSYEVDFSDGISTCTFVTKYFTQTNGREFNLANSTYYTLLAKGPMRNDRVSYHSMKASTQQPVNFTALDAIEAEGVSDSIKIHGVVTEKSLPDNSGAYLNLSILLILALLGLQVLLQAGFH
ncbi:ferric-chelate reductase 1 [Caerostris darwini]|uniref:Ferric-chelate reductase 1 n=1 Tax=Caerostris darwini TaxID=1538125 RepID=A0AAV4X5M5_9ARAC|nr:ferric-chelate reductase 1 [Caerostris darwini]